MGPPTLCAILNCWSTALKALKTNFLNRLVTLSNGYPFGLSLKVTTVLVISHNEFLYLRVLSLNFSPVLRRRDSVEKR